ncbi:TNF receptor-associated factor 6-like [Corticium candelabrum]|uniref:TNF receptor-associated factor 6-like n=1 Tax=Corticium candelabrum TaxID=121492 RepID=UPI002E254B5A|nr:TNF receptor-associated factor 6-like [Corticium candelabrum]
MADVPQGFDAVFVEPLDEKFTCPICQLACREPTLTQCGHHFCSSCMTLCLYRSASCPVCRTELQSTNTFPNNAMKREILDLKVKCWSHEKGCAWNGELRYGRDHHRECQYVDVACVNGCEQLVMRKDMDDHMANHCPEGMISCTHCDLNMKRVELEVHYKTCDEYPVDCTYKCGMMVQRCQIEDHIASSCPNIPFDCDYKDDGCQFKGNRHDLSKHIESNVVFHLGLIASSLKETKQRLAANELKLDTTKQELHDAIEELTVTRDELEETRNELAETKDELAETRDELTETSVQLSIEVHRRSLSLSPQTPKQFIFTWTIDNWHEKVRAFKEKNDATGKISSGPFYVYPGYRLYIGVYPNGFTTDYTGYLGVVLFATEGQFDETVRWPFPFSFDFELVDQQVGGKNICGQLSPPYGNALECSTCRVGYGNAKLASHEDLESRCYIKDDSICIKLCVNVKKEDDHE